MTQSQILQKQAELVAWSLKVRKIIATSQYPSGHSVAEYHLKLSDSYLAGALNTVSPELMQRHFALCEQSLEAAEKAASETKFAQQQSVSEFYSKIAGGSRGINI